ncbi:MAG: phosphatidate cytidylyltransferase [Alphaproteobacteria bacterium]|uniref:Phosphatidate cytidylyltransferase n=1 Tax=Candidatus Nitrobium versatile TaxID=2884831 RepID=A0A953JD61_9BACT|nr:phosphatidate cytidylyltransferase [Candidatus Nitrobium versatile]
MRRVIVAAIVLPLLYLYITRLPASFFLLLLVLVAAAAQGEFYVMYRTKRSILLPGILCGTGLLAGVTLYSHYSASGVPPLLYPVLSMLSFMLIVSSRLFSIKDPSSSLADIAPAVTGFLYIPTLLLPQWFLRQQGYEWILFLYGCVWASDSVALYVGKGLGKRKLYREVSPNKTVEGAIGSVAGGALSGLLLGSLLLKGVGIPASLLMGSAVGAVTILGDLVESMFKRDAGVKDSSSLFPEHGGVLDKIDGVLFAGPVLFLITLGL